MWKPYPDRTTANGSPAVTALKTIHGSAKVVTAPNHPLSLQAGIEVKDANYMPRSDKCFTVSTLCGAAGDA